MDEDQAPELGAAHCCSWRMRGALLLLADAGRTAALDGCGRLRRVAAGSSDAPSDRLGVRRYRLARLPLQAADGGGRSRWSRRRRSSGSASWSADRSAISLDRMMSSNPAIAIWR